MADLEKDPKTHLIILLGNRNHGDRTSTSDRAMELFQIVKDRASKAVDLVDANEKTWILPTGYWGKHFNMTLRAHGELVTEHLNSFPEVKQLRAAKQLQLVNYTRSSGTHQDAWLAFRRLSELEEEVGRFSKLSVVTSSFHMERVKLIFGNVFKEREINYISVAHSNEALNEIKKDDERVCSLEEHEKEAIKGYLEYGVLMPWDPSKLQEGYRNLGNELRHYDKLSYFVIFASFAIAYSFFKLDISWPWALVLALPFLYFQSLFAKLYLRLAETARSCRRTMEAVEMAYGIPGISNTNRQEINLLRVIKGRNIAKQFYRADEDEGIADIVIAIIFIISFSTVVAVVAKDLFS